MGRIGQLEFLLETEATLTRTMDSCPERHLLLRPLSLHTTSTLHESTGRWVKPPLEN